MTWYRQYRPRLVSDLHLLQIRETLIRWMKQGHLPQVILLAGPKGTGKTTTSRLIGAMVNDPANQAIVKHLFFGAPAPDSTELKEASESDVTEAILQGTSFLVQEIDAASNRGIEEIRALRERSQLPPPTGLMSVFILDEAHMLTTEAFNALLKLLEEPPPHALFLLATTELHKIPATIQSRATALQFSRAETTELVAALERVLKAEKVEFEAEAIERLAIAADGSFRDAVKLAELAVAGSQTLSISQVEAVLSRPVTQDIELVLKQVLAKDAPGLVATFRTLRERRVEPVFFGKQFLSYLHAELLKSLEVVPGSPVAPYAVTHFLLTHTQDIATQANGPIPFLALELKLLDLIFRSQEKKASPTNAASPPSKKTISTRSKAVEVVPSEAVANEVTSAQADPAAEAHTPAPAIAPVQSRPTAQAIIQNVQAVPAGDSQRLLAEWESFLQAVDQRNSTLAALLRSAKLLQVDGDRAQIAVFYKFHQEQLQQPKFMRLIEDCVIPLVGGTIAFEFIVSDNSPATPTDVVPTNSPPATQRDPLQELAEAALV